MASATLFRSNFARLSHVDRRAISENRTLDAAEARSDVCWFTKQGNQPCDCGH